jgi:hypothetical protein
VLSWFRIDFYDCLTARADALFELADAVLCTDGPVRLLVDLALAPEHRRSHGALYAGLNRGRMDVTWLRRALAEVPLLRAADGRLVLAAHSIVTPPHPGRARPPSPVRPLGPPKSLCRRQHRGGEATAFD